MSHLTNAQCCEIQIAYDQRLQQVLPKTSDLEACFSDKSCDTRYYHAIKMLKAAFASDLDETRNNFRKILEISKNNTSYDELDLMIAYSYASYLESNSRSTEAQAYYKFIENRATESSTLKILSAISSSGINGNSESTLELLNSFDIATNNNLSVEDRMFIIQKSSNYLNPRVAYSLFNKYKYLYKRTKDNANRFSYLLHLQYYISQEFDSENREFWHELIDSEFDVHSSRLISGWREVLSNTLMSNGKYNEALTQTKENLANEIGEFTTNSELLKREDQFGKVSYRLLTEYAHANLFQTRLGKGLPPVVDAFNIYEAAYKKRLQKRIKNLVTITSEQDIKYARSPNDIIIVGIYLYENTHDIQYLNRTYSIINGMAAGGISYWSMVRELMRNDDSIEKVILEEQKLVASIINTSDEDRLIDIYNRQVALEDFRTSTETARQTFYGDIMDSYQVDLESLQQKMKRDTAASLNFFISGKALYRLYVSPDTIDVLFIEDDARHRSLKLTEQLSTMVESGKSAAEMAEASRELYRHLFAGIEEDLPPKLHLIVNGALLNVPFSVLRKDKAGESPRYLGVEHAISRQFSLGTMKMLEETELDPSYTQPLAMAPSFANEFLQASELRQAGFQLPPLVYNTEELNDLQSRGGGEYLFDNDATIERYRDQVSDYNIIHLATHAISSEVDGLRSRVYLLDDEGQPTGLYAGDIGQQTLNSELVVLSACETGGGGTHYVEGRVGLTKAYLAAGARSVVASNWAVDDHATAEQMGTFYDGIEAGQPPHVALQGARKAYLEAHPDAAPYKWAAFEAYGGMGPVRWDKNSGTGNWWWMVFPVLGVGALVAWNKKRRVGRAA